MAPAFAASPIARPTTARAALALVLAILIAHAVAVGWIVAAPAPSGAFSDGVDYLELATALGGGESDAAVLSAHRYPPLYPAVLALLGAGIEAPARAIVVGAAAGWAALALLAAWLWREIAPRAAPALAAAAFVALALPPQFSIYPLLDVATEPLSLLLLAGALLLARPGAGPLALTALALLAALLPLVRIAGLALTLAASAWLLAAGGPHRRLRVALALAAPLPALGWLAARAGSGRESYLDYLSPAVVAGTYGGPTELVATRALALADGMLATVAPSNPVAFAAAGLALLLGVGGLWLRARAQRLDAWFVLPYLALVALWPFPAETQRLLLLAWPAWVAASVEGGLALGRRLGPHAALPALLVTAGLAVAALPAATAAVGRAMLPVPVELAALTRREAYLGAPDADAARDALELDARILAALERLPQHVPPGECVYSQTPAYVRLHGRVAAAMIPPRLGQPDEARRRLARCRFLLVLGRPTRQHAESPQQLLELAAPWTRPVFVGTTPVRADGAARETLAVALLEWRTDADDAP